jgi:hypothetical protein
MRIKNIQTKAVSLLTAVSLVTMQSSAVLAAPVKTFDIAATGPVKVVMYNEFTCGTPIDGTTALTGAAAYNNVGTLEAGLESGNFLGVKDAGLAFKDAAGNQELYNILTGVGTLEYTPATRLPISGLTPNPHAGELLISPAGVKNPAIIDTYDAGVMMLDADGTTSGYWTTLGTMFADYTYSSLTGGGNMNGVLMADLAANPNFIGIENLYYMTLNAAGTGTELYSTLTGTYVSTYSVVTPLSGGPLAGKTVKDAVQDTHGVAGITFKGIGNTDLVFYDSVNKMTVSYNFLTLANTWAGFAISSPTNGNLTLGAFAGPVDSAMTSGRFLGVAENSLVFIDIAGNMHSYNFANGIGVGTYSYVQPLEGPQAGNEVDDNFIDTVDLGNVYLDEDGTTSVYFDTGVLYLDQHWTTFTGREMDGIAPTPENIVATEDTLFYTLDADGSLDGYNYLGGLAWAGGDLWTCTSFTGGVLDGKTLVDAINNEVAGVNFLGIANDQLVFAYFTPVVVPPVVVEPPTPVTPPATPVTPVVTVKPVTSTVLGASTINAPNTGLGSKNETATYGLLLTGLIVGLTGLTRKYGTNKN